MGIPCAELLLWRMTRRWNPALAVSPAQVESSGARTLLLSRDLPHSDHPESREAESIAVELGLNRTVTRTKAGGVMQ